MRTRNLLSRREFLALSASVAGSPLQSRARPNILLIVADDLGYSDLGCYGDLTRMGSRDTYHSVGSGWANASNTPWRMYKHYSHEGGISTPCIAHWPAGFRRRNAIEHVPAHLIDLMPTLVAASGATYPERVEARAIPPMAGSSLMPALHGERMPERTLYFEHEGTRAVREGRYKLTALRGEGWKLYDMERDRTELKDLAGEQPGRVEQLAKKWDHWAAENHVTPLPATYPVHYLRGGTR